MAVDEALLHSAARTGEAALRFYQWATPTLSLGYFQPVADRRGHAASAGCAVVRRATGGGAILHHRELTYSFTAPAADRRPGEARGLYEVFHGSLIRALRTLGAAARLHGEPARGEIDEPFLCFQRRTLFDVVAARGGSCDGKIAGSAQRRHRGAVLQHGSILLESSPHAPELRGIAEAHGVSIRPETLMEAWLPLIEERLDLRSEAAELSEAEKTDAAQIEREKFAARSWTARR